MNVLFLISDFCFFIVYGGCFARAPQVSIHRAGTVGRASRVSRRRRFEQPGRSTRKETAVISAQITGRIRRFWCGEATA